MKVSIVRVIIWGYGEAHDEMGTLGVPPGPSWPQWPDMENEVLSCSGLYQHGSAVLIRKDARGIRTLELIRPFVFVKTVSKK